MASKCEKCLDSGKVARDGTPQPVIAEKDGKREAWVGLLARTEFVDCPDCGGPIKRVYKKNPKNPRWGKGA